MAPIRGGRYFSRGCQHGWTRGRKLLRDELQRRRGTEPDDRSVEAINPWPNGEGSPDLYGYFKGTTATKPDETVYYDNYQVTQSE